MKTGQIFKIIVFSILFLEFGLVNTAISKVDPPNYNFSLDALAVFQPGGSWAALKKRYGEGELVEDNNGTRLLKYYVSHTRYKFPVWVQVRGGKVLDFYARLPSYFLHDVFHQSLINRLGQQDQYIKKENSAVYIWKNEDGVRHTYSGSCTITCFPMYYTAMPVDKPGDAVNYKSLFKKFSLRRPQEN